MGRCDTAPVLEIGHNHIDFTSLEKVEEAIAADDAPRITDYQDLAAYQADGGYKGGVVALGMAVFRSPGSKSLAWWCWISIRKKMGFCAGC